MPRFGGAEKCAKCTKSVYQNERVAIESTGDTVVLHKVCFRCAKDSCNKKLEISNYTSHDGEYYCKSCYTYMVKESGISSVDKKERRKSGYIPSAGGSFLPAGSVESTDVKKSTGEQSERAKAIAAKFGGGEKKVCHTCGQRVFALEEVAVESADGTSISFHKTCLKCKECSSILRTETLVQVGDDIYCKTHGKERQKEFRKSTNYGGAESSAKASSLAKKLGGATNKCVVCDKACYMTDGLEVSAGNETLHVHKACFSCAEEECPKKLTIESYVRVGHSFYCKNHGADAQGIRGRGISVSHATSFLPDGAVESTEVKKSTGEQSERAKAIAAKLGGTSEKCEICGTTVYQLEKVSVESSSDTTVVHKSCFKCSEPSCGTSLTLGSYVKSDGAYYCKTHAPKGQAVRDGGMYTAVMGQGDGQLSAAAGGSGDDEPRRDEQDVDPEQDEPEAVDEEPEPEPEAEAAEEEEPEPEAEAEEEAAPAAEAEEEPAADEETEVADGHEEAEPEEAPAAEAALGDDSGFDADAERERRRAEREAERAARRAAEEAEEAERAERRRQREEERAARRAAEEE